jgi:hypothetical protein
VDRLELDLKRLGDPAWMESKMGLLAHGVTQRGKAASN